MRYENKVIRLSNYATTTLDYELYRQGAKGFRLVSTLLANNEHETKVMYLFFTKEMVGEGE